MRTLSAGGADVVSDVLRAVRVRSTVYCRSEMGAPWGFGVEAHGNPTFHVVTHGRCWLEVDGGTPAKELVAGDLVLLPTGPRHWMRDHPSSATPVLEDLLAAAPESANGRLRHGGDGARTGLVCGGFALEGDAANPIVRALPPVVHVRGTESEAVSWVAATLELVDAVAESDAPGADAVLARIADTMLTQALRVALADLAAQTPERVLALRDPQIAGAIHLVHGQPERRWTVGELASEVGYSRSAFASRFREVVGESPIAYLTRTRLELAAALLQRADSTLAEVARRSGYTSEYAFNRAFKRAFAVTPGAYRAQPAAERPDVVAAGSSFVTGA